MIAFLEIIGTVAFAVSGAMVGIQKKMDILGIVILGMTTACGGGIIRDLIIDVTPPMAFQNPVYALTAIAVSVVVFLPAIRKHIDTDGKTLIVMDAVGLGIFTVIGVMAGEPFHNGFLSVFLGAVTGVGGGVMRDIFAGDKPFIFVRHFYASASIIGAILCYVLLSYSENIAMIAGTVTIIILRILAAKYKWHLPKA